MRSRTLIFIVLIATLILSRAPFFSQMLLGEEGSFAALVASSIPSSEVTPNNLPQMLIGRVGGEPVYYPFQRNITPYLLIERIAGTTLRALGLADAGPQQITIAVRFAYFSFFAIGAAGLLWMAAKSWLSILVAAFALGTPLAFGASIQPQIDGSTGVALVGLSCLLLLGRSHSPPWFAIVLAGFLIGLGRHELSLALAAAAIATLTLQWMLGSLTDQRIGLFCAGLGLGIMTAILISPTDYAMGYATMGRVYSTPSSRLSVLRTQFVFVWPVWLLMIVTLSTASWHLRGILREHPQIILVSLGATAIALGFSVSGWTGDGFPRYYAPALIAFCYALVALLQFIPPAPKLVAATASICLLVAVLANATTLARSLVAGTSITSMPGVSLSTMENRLAETATRTRAEDSIALEQSSLWVYHAGVDFIGIDVGPESARQILKERYPDQLSRLSVQ